MSWHRIPVAREGGGEERRDGKERRTRRGNRSDGCFHREHGMAPKKVPASDASGPSPSTTRPSSSEVDSLKKKIATLTVINGALQKENDALQASAREGRGGSVDEEALQELEEAFAARLAEADDTIAALKSERDDLRAELDSSARGGDANAALAREKEARLLEYKNELEASSRKNGELEGTVRKLQLTVKDFKQENERMTNRMRLHDETAAEAARSAAGREEKLKAEIGSLRQRLAADNKAADDEVLDLRQKLAAAAARAQDALGAQAQKVLDAAEARAVAAEADAAQLRINISETEAASAAREDALRAETAAVTAELRALQRAGADAKYDDDEGSGGTEHISALARQMEAAVSSARAERSAAEAKEAELVERANAARRETEAATSAVRDANARAIKAEATVRALREQLSEQLSEAAECRRKFEAEAGRADSATAEAEAARRERDEAMSMRETLEWQLQVARETEARLTVELSHANKAVANMREALEEAAAATSGVEESSSGVGKAAKSTSGKGRERSEESSSSASAAAADTPATTGLPPGSSQNETPSVETGLGGGGGFSVDALLHAQSRDESSTGSMPWLTKKEQQLVTAERAAAAKREAAAASVARADAIKATASKLEAIEAEAAALRARAADAERRAETAQAAARLAEEAAASAKAASVATEPDGTAAPSASALQRLRGDLDTTRGEYERLMRDHEMLLEVLGEKTERVEQLEDDAKEMKRRFQLQLDEAAARGAETAGRDRGGERVDESHAAFKARVAAAAAERQGLGTGERLAPALAGDGAESSSSTQPVKVFVSWDVTQPSDD